MTKKAHFEMVTFSIDPNTLHDLKALSKEDGLPLARFLRTLVESGLEVYKGRNPGKFSSEGDPFEIRDTDRT
jgi:hypothetical protein